MGEDVYWDVCKGQKSEGQSNQVQLSNSKRHWNLVFEFLDEIELAAAKLALIAVHLEL